MSEQRPPSPIPSRLQPVLAAQDADTLSDAPIPPTHPSYFDQSAPLEEHILENFAGTHAARMPPNVPYRMKAPKFVSVPGTPTASPVQPLSDDHTSYFDGLTPLEERLVRTARELPAELCPPGTPKLQDGDARFEAATPVSNVIRSVCQC